MTHFYCVSVPSDGVLLIGCSAKRFDYPGSTILSLANLAGVESARGRLPWLAIARFCGNKSEFEVAGNTKAKRGYSRDSPDCKQVNIDLVVTPEGLPIEVAERRVGR